MQPMASVRFAMFQIQSGVGTFGPGEHPVPVGDTASISVPDFPSVWGTGAPTAHTTRCGLGKEVAPLLIIAKGACK